MKKAYFILAFLFTGILLANAQNWLRDMRDPRVNFFTVQKEFNAWWAINGNPVLKNSIKGEGMVGEEWKLYKRWEHNMLPRMKATNGVRLGPVDLAEKNFYQQQQAQHALRGGAGWTYIGPQVSFDDGTGDSSTGRVNCVRFDPINHNVIYCGAPTGGLWKSSDFGGSWTLLNTDKLPQIGVSDIAINPQNPNTIYIATGDIANSECLSVGVFKSVNGGQSWDTTGLSWTISQGVLIARLLMDPLDSNTMYAATNIGIFKTTNGGANWNNMYAVDGFTGMEFNPLNSNTIYAWGYQLYKSVNAGLTWAKLTNGLPDAQVSGGFAIGLTPVDTSCVYVLVSGAAVPSQAYSPYNGVYRSLDAGDTFKLRSASPDQQGTQGTYDLNVGVSPVDENMVVVAAVQCDFSTDGGVTWSSPVQASHVDHHDIRFFNGSGDTVFSADDGGLFISADGGNAWQGVNDGMHIGEIYNVSSGSRTQNLSLSGRQDDGTLLLDTTSEAIVSGGDGMQCLIDPLDENHLLGSIEEGILGVSYNDGQTNSILVYNWAAGVNGEGAWNTPFAMQRDNSQYLYIAKDYVYVSGNAGDAWKALNSPKLPADDNLYQFMVVAPTDSSYIYAATYSALYRSTDWGDTFTNVTGFMHGTFTSLAVSESNPAEIWVGFYSDEGGINGSVPELLHSTNAGTQFENYSTGLPLSGAFYPVSIAPVKDSKNALYISLANAGGIYYRDSTLNSWMPYSTGLPNVTVSQLEVDYCTGKIRAATYGRDLWESAAYVPLTVPPIANASYTSTEADCNVSETFTDLSDYNPTAWQWYFPGGQPASSMAENPVVVYPGGNNYTATLIASNANGADTVQYLIQTAICTGIKPFNANDAVKIYPNPANSSFVVETGNNAQQLLQVYDMTARLMLEQHIYNSKTTIDASALAVGLYTVNLINPDGIITEKLVVAR